jgi:cyclophilin family peptidyl-prolyl cis-trans isomerase
VSNFLNYVDRGDYSESIVHRAAPNFVVQGGGFKPAPPNFTRIPTDPSPTNEPGIQHVRGTVAMAKVGGNPNSATCQWFVNLKDNSAELDDQNGGFASFGRVCGSGLDVIDAMAALPRGAYAVNVDGQTNTFTDWPLNTAPPAPATMDQSKLVLVTSVRRIEPLSFSVPGSTVPGVATAAVVGTNLMLSPSGIYGGTTVVSVVATDLDGHSLTQAVTVEVASAYSSWLARYSLQGPDALPGADYDGDTRPNAVEFALGGSPVLSDADTIQPVPLVVNLGGSVYGALAFRLRKDLSGLMVWLKSAPAVAGASWNNVWSSADLTGSQVWQRTNQGEFWWLTVRDATPLATGTSQRFLRLVVSVSP